MNKENKEKTTRLCVIIPTYNNGNTVMKVIGEVEAFCRDIIVVDDGSTDGTKDLLSTLPGTVSVVSYEHNRGKGHALVMGFRRAKELGFTHAITIDADGQHRAEDIPKFIAELPHCPQGIIVGARNLAEKNMPQQNTFANKFSNFWFRLQTGINLPDTQSGFRLYTLDALCGLNLITSRYEAELELLVYAAWHGVEITWVPVSVYYPPVEERVSHFRPAYDFTRISILNTVLTFLSFFLGLKQWVYTVLAFCYFLFRAMSLTLQGFILLTLGGATDKHKQFYHRKLQRTARFAIHHVGGTTFSYSNPTGEDFSKPAVIVCNHESHLDLMAVMMFTPNLIILTKDWVWHNPFYGLIIRYADFLPVSEGEEMMPKLEAMVKKGYSVMVFPEGTRSEDCRVHRFHRGAFLIAEKLGLDIIPVKIHGFGWVLPKKSWHLHPGRMTMEVMARIRRADGLPGYREMTRRVHSMYTGKETKA